MKVLRWRSAGLTSSPGERRVEVVRLHDVAGTGRSSALIPSTYVHCQQHGQQMQETSAALQQGTDQNIAMSEGGWFHV